jgi:hypothetical protein
MIVTISPSFPPFLICNLHAPVQRLRVNHHVGIVLDYRARKLALRLGETLPDGEHTVDDDCIYTFLYLAL